ncbi:AAA family ATPase [Jeongeupia chitinilytica]|nr:ATP-binding protein [Jeongeupia chitinilytica]
MLVEFSVENFRSIHMRQTFSMVAAPRLRRKGNTFEPELNGERFPRLLKVAAVYGPNASGKSSLVSALALIPRIASHQPDTSDAELPVSPFRFCPNARKKPSCFEVHFIHEKMRYEFILHLTKERITKEKLVIHPKGKEVVLYERTASENNKDEYFISPDLEGGEIVIEAWKQLTNPKTLFISQAVANSNTELNQLRTPFLWLQKGVMPINSRLSRLTPGVLTVLNEVPEISDELAEYLSDLDIPISKIKQEIKEVEVDNAESYNDDFSRKLDNFEKNHNKTTLTHKTSLGEADFDLKEESDGTKSLLGFWLPLKIANMKRNITSALVIDELDSSLHPSIIASIVERHLNSTDDFQLIFTTHDTHLMDTRLLRRDQLWLTDRDETGATQLRSIHDFAGRESEDIEKRYFEGKYRGIPFVRKGY